MKCSLVGDQARVLAKFLQFLAKIGPDLYIEALEDGMGLGTANSSSSGYASVKLCPTFFQSYVIDPEQIETGDNCCRVALKACVPIFRSLKSVETCDIRMNQSASKLIIQLHCRENTTKTHFVSILQLETLSAPTRKNSGTMNTLVASQKVFSDILSIFNNTEEELTIDANKKGITVKNYIESIHANRQQMRTQLSLDAAEFDTYGVETDTSVTFCLKEWRAFLLLAESLNTNIIINFETTGLPIEFTVRDLDVFDVTLFMSTLSSELDDSRNSSVIVVSDSTQAQARASTKKRAHETVDEELNALLKKPKSRKKQTQAQESNIQFSNPDIEDFSNNESGTDSSAINNHNRWTIARNGGGNDLLQVPTIASRVSTLSPRTTIHHNHQSQLDIIFLKDTEEDTDETLLSIPMPIDDVQPSSLETVQGTATDAAGDEIPISPGEANSRVRRKAALALFRRCYEPSFRYSNITGLNRILAENSSDEEDHG